MRFIALSERMLVYTSIFAGILLMASTGIAQDPPTTESVTKSAEKVIDSSQNSPKYDIPVDVTPSPSNAELPPGADRQTGIRGKIVSSKPRGLLPNAPVIAQDPEGNTHQTLSDEQGKYILLVPPGLYDVRSYYRLYHGGLWRDIRVQRGEFKDLNFILDPIEPPIVELEIPYLADTSSEQAQLNIRKEAVNVQDAISAEEISKTGDGSAESAAQRVVGATVDEDGRLIVRGLGGRYTRVLLNGLDVPSTDPDEPGLQLDLIPTSALSSFAIIKTARADLPGDFAGGIGMLDTVLFPREFQLKVGLSTAYNTLTTFKDRLHYPGGNLDWLGFDDGTRSLPSGISGRKFGDVPGTLARQFGGTWEFQRRNAPPNLGIDVSIGNSVDLKSKKRLGYTAAFEYGLNQVRKTGSLIKGGITQELVGSVLPAEEGSQEATLTGFGTLTLQLNRDNYLTSLLLYSRSAESTTTLQTGFDREKSRDIQNWQLDFLARQLIYSQVSGDHQNLGDTKLGLRWTVFGSFATRDQPDLRNVTYLVNDAGALAWDPSLGVALRRFNDLKQYDIGTRFRLRFPMWDRAYGSVGVYASQTHREFQQRSFTVLPAGGGALPDSELTKPANELFAPGNFNTLLVYRDTTDATGKDAYDADRLSLATFAMLETPLGKRFKLGAGVRLETVVQEIVGSTLDRTQTDTTSRTWVDPLPSVALSYQVIEGMFIRAAYAATVSRPEFREQAPFRFLDALRGRAVTGNSDLKRARIHNADLRWEWFFGDTGLIAVTGFWKEFIDPIEQQIFQTGDIQLSNADGGRALGVEFELRSNLKHLHEKLKLLSLAANATLAKSKVRLTEEQKQFIRGDREVFGQSPYVINLSLRFDKPDAGVNATLVYNVFGPRLTAVGTRGSTEFTPPNEKEQPFHSLDLVFGWKPTEHWKLKAKARNLLVQSRRFKQGPVLTRKANIGATISFGAEYIY